MRSEDLRFDVETDALENRATEYLNVKVFCDNDIVNWHDEMIQSLHQHEFLRRM
jgi:hypothetical protein